jgi:hypothetical protein
MGSYEPSLKTKDYLHCKSKFWLNNDHYSPDSGWAMTIKVQILVELWLSKFRFRVYLSSNLDYRPDNLQNEIIQCYCLDLWLYINILYCLNEVRKKNLLSRDQFYSFLKVGKVFSELLSIWMYLRCNNSICGMINLTFPMNYYFIMGQCLKAWFQSDSCYQR